MRFLFLACVCAQLPLSGMIMYDSGDPAYHTTDPEPTKGWMYEGYVGSFLGTMIGPRHFITADHIFRPSTFVSDATFNGSGTVTYNVDSAYNEGQYDLLGNVVPGRTVPGTDFRIYQIQETFPAWAQLYTKSNETGKAVRYFGDSAVRGTPITNGAGTQVGWANDTSLGFGTARWTNEVASSVDADFIYTQFTAGAENAILASGDSGGGLFINDGGTWKLAGVNYASVQGPWDKDADHSVYYPSASVYSPNGMYVEDSVTGWQLWNPTQQVFSVHSRISASASAIQSMLVVVVPEPSALMMLSVCGLLKLTGRRRHREAV